MIGIVAFLIILIVAGSFLILSPESVPNQISEFGTPILSAGLIGLIIIAVLKFFGIVD